MTLRIKILFPALVLSSFGAASQKLTKNDKITLANLETHTGYLSDNKLEGRKIGSPGEKAAGDYIISVLSKAGLRPKGDGNGWLQTFTIDKGRQISADTRFSVNDHPLLLNEEWFPLAISPAGQVSGSPAIALQERGVPWFLDLKELLEAGGGPNAHPDLAVLIRAKAASFAKKGATALILYNSSHYPDKLGYDPAERPLAAAIPVLYITREAKRKYLKDESASLDLRINIGYTEKQLTGHNILGYLDNGAPSTVIIGARYDHPADVPAGADSNSAVARNFANDNPGGVPALLELARLLAASKSRNNNYLFIAFSCGDMDRTGSAWFAEHPVTDLKNTDYMIDLDRIDRLNDTTHALTIGGYTSSPLWATVINSIRDRKYFSLRYDSAGPGDQACFYRRKIPVLLFTTGDGKISFPGEVQVLKFVLAIIEGANSRGRAGFTP